MQKSAAMRPLVVKTFSDCRRKKAGILLNLWKISDKILWITTFLHNDCGNTSIDVSERSKPAWLLMISLIILQINQYFWKLRMSKGCCDWVFCDWVPSATECPATECPGDWVPPWSWPAGRWCWRQGWSWERWTEWYRWRTLAISKDWMLRGWEHWRHWNLPADHQLKLWQHTRTDSCP
jgi:hypothetical protein